jgi:type IV pilus biogenesis protein CpaD/CtpE
MNRRLPSFAALAMSAGLVLAACGDDDEPSTPATEPATVTTEQMTDTTEPMTDDSMTDDSMTDMTSNMEDTTTSTP